MPSRVFSSSLLVCLLAPAFGAASPVDLYGGAPLQLSTGGGLTAGTLDGSAAYFNPAGLGVAGYTGRASIQLGYVHVAPTLSISRTAGTADAELPNYDPLQIGYVAGSVLVPIGGIIQNKATLGALFAVPQDGLLNVESIEPQRPQWARYGTESDRIAVAAGLGVRPIEQLSVGLGIHTLAAFTGRNTFTVHPMSSSNEAFIGGRTVQFSLKSLNAATAGITVIPVAPLSVAFSYRGQVQLQISEPVGVDLGDLGTMNIQTHGDVLYSPHEVTLGLRYAPGGAWWAALDLRYQLWGLAPAAAREPFNVNIDAGDSIVLAVATSQTAQPSLTFSNVFVPTLAGEYSWFDRLLTVRGAYSFRPTYLQRPNDEENLLDVDAHILSLGATILWKDPIHLFPHGLNVDLAFQAQVLPTARVNRPEGRPVGSLTYGGAVITGGAGLRMEI